MVPLFTVGQTRSPWSSSTPLLHTPHPLHEHILCSIIFENIKYYKILSCFTYSVAVIQLNFLFQMFFLNPFLLNFSASCFLFPTPSTYIRPYFHSPVFNILMVSFNLNDKTLAMFHNVQYDWASPPFWTHFKPLSSSYLCCFFVSNYVTWNEWKINYVKKVSMSRNWECRLWTSGVGDFSWLISSIHLFSLHLPILTSYTTQWSQGYGLFWPGGFLHLYRSLKTQSFRHVSANMKGSNRELYPPAVPCTLVNTYCFCITVGCVGIETMHPGLSPSHSCHFSASYQPFMFWPHQFLCSCNTPSILVPDLYTCYSFSHDLAPNSLSLFWNFIQASLKCYHTEMLFLDIKEALPVPLLCPYPDIFTNIFL